MPFPTTQWSLIACATINGGREGREALNELCRRYRKPVLSFFRSKHLTAEDAEDLTQILFQKMLDNRLWVRANAEKGRFRNYLLTIAFNGLVAWKKAATAVKRGNGAKQVSLEFLCEEGWEPQTPDDGAALEFDQGWACSAMSAAWNRIVKAASATPEKAARFAVLRRFLPGSESPPTCEAAAAEMGTSPENVRTLVSRLREEFRSALREEVADTLLSADDLEDEMTHLCHVLAAGRGTLRQPSAESLQHSGESGPVSS
jgi:DNA-directed RNA polymerase specialized sigma24 family protein